MMYIRQMQILVQAQICTWLIVYPKTGAHGDISLRYNYVETVVLLSHKKPDRHINVKIEFGESEGKVSLDKIAERAKKYQPKPKTHIK